MLDAIDFLYVRGQSLQVALENPYQSSLARLNFFLLVREMTSGDIGPMVKSQLIKETILGVVHGFAVGIICAVVMYVIATGQNNPHAVVLSAIILFSMTASCVVSGVMGAIVPITLKKFGADPAAGSSIILTTGTDVVSMGVMLFLANKFILGN